MAHQEEHGGHEEQVNPIQLQKYLGGIDYPVDKQTLLENAKSQGADDNAMSALERLPDQEFNSPNDVSEQIGKQR